MRGVEGRVGADFHYYSWVDQYNTLGMGENIPIANGSPSDSLLALDPKPGDATPEHILVLTDARSDTARLGLEVDRVLGFIDGPGAKARGRDPVAERRPAGGRIASILDPARLIECARKVIERTPSGD